MDFIYEWYINILNIVFGVSFWLYVLNDKYKSILNTNYVTRLFLDTEELKSHELTGTILMLHLIIIFPFTSDFVGILLAIFIILSGLLYINHKINRSEIIDSYLVLFSIVICLIIISIAAGIYYLISRIDVEAKEKYNKFKKDNDFKVCEFEEFKILNSNNKHEHSDLN